MKSKFGLVLSFCRTSCDIIKPHQFHYTAGSKTQVPLHIARVIEIFQTHRFNSQKLLNTSKTSLRWTCCSSEPNKTINNALIQEAGEEFFKKKKSLTRVIYEIKYH